MRLPSTAPLLDSPYAAKSPPRGTSLKADKSVVNAPAKIEPVAIGAWRAARLEVLAAVLIRRTAAADISRTGDAHVRHVGARDRAVSVRHGARLAGRLLKHGHVVSRAVRQGSGESERPVCEDRSGAECAAR